MSGRSPVISICVPTFNRAWLLERNVTFHLQAFRAREIAFEIVVVDDCSTDETASYLATLADVPELVHYRRHKNSGFLENYAFAMRRAKGRYAIFLGDDDLLIPDQVIAYVDRLESDPALGMIQAPWMEVDARAGERDLGPFYKLATDVRLPKGNHAGLADFILERHIFPEFMIIRREILAKAISSASPFIFWAFLFTARALAYADVLFVPAPFARVTALSDDPRLRQGNNETMFKWDHYRGGVEYIVGLALRPATTSIEQRTATTLSINKFMAVRLKVALRLLIGARHWAEAYVLAHRMMAYEPSTCSLQQLTEIGHMAGFTTAAYEAATYSDEMVIADPAINADLMALLKPEVREKLLPYDPALPSKTEGSRTYLRLDAAFQTRAKPNDVIFDINDYVAQFV